MLMLAGKISKFSTNQVETWTQSYKENFIVNLLYAKTSWAKNGNVTFSSRSENLNFNVE